MVAMWKVFQDEMIVSEVTFQAQVRNTAKHVHVAKDHSRLHEKLDDPNHWVAGQMQLIMGPCQALEKV